MPGSASSSLRDQRRLNAVFPIAATPSRSSRSLQRPRRPAEPWTRQLIGTTIALGTFTRALLAAAPLLAKDPKGRLDALRFGGEGWKSIGELLLGGFVQGYVWAWWVASFSPRL